jgi:hypothetical protein
MPSHIPGRKIINAHFPGAKRDVPGGIISDSSKFDVRSSKGKGGDDRIADELIYGADESGFQKGIGQKERVIGGKGKKRQHQQRSGDRENITVLVNICGDGTSTPPLVIYKGAAFQTSWKQDNPLNAS